MATGIKNFSVRGIGNNQDPHNTNFQSESKELKKNSVASYIFMPGIIPQVKELTQGGFGYLALLIAVVYQAVRILPANHPYTRYENLGKFGIRQVIGAAANNVKFNKRNIDQIIVFFAILAGLVILLLQLLAFVGILISGQAWAQPAATFTGLFSTPNPQTDIAFFMLREVFGIPGMFGTLTGGQTSLHIALQSLIQFYNLAILVVAIVVFVYYVIVVVAPKKSHILTVGTRCALCG